MCTQNFATETNREKAKHVGNAKFTIWPLPPLGLHWLVAPPPPLRAAVAPISKHRLLLGKVREEAAASETLREAWLHCSLRLRAFRAIFSRKRIIAERYVLFL